MYYDAIEEIENNIPIENNNEFDFNFTVVYSIYSTANTNQFCNTYNHDNKYNGLKLGQCIQIYDGMYNIPWMIAGFDCEADNIADDGNPNNNGYGICLIPRTTLLEAVWDDDNNNAVPYINSSIHNTCGSVGNRLRNVLGNHLIKRNVLLSSKINTDSTGRSSAYTWTTSYCEILTTNQIIGRMDSGIGNRYDKGEANYKLPVYNEINFTKYSANDGAFIYWIRERNSGYAYHTAARNGFGSISSSPVVFTQNLNPMIYIR